MGAGSLPPLESRNSCPIEGEVATDLSGIPSGVGDIETRTLGVGEGGGPVGSLEGPTPR